MSDNHAEAYDRGVFHGWDSANYAEAYGAEETFAAEAIRRGRDLYPLSGCLQLDYADGFATGVDRFDAGEYADGTKREHIYPTREDYAREVWRSLDERAHDDILTDYGYPPMVECTNDQWHEFLGYFTDNMDARNNGAVAFTRVSGGYVVDDEARPLMTFDEAEAAGLDGTGRDGDPRFPFHVGDKREER